VACEEVTVGRVLGERVEKLDGGREPHALTERIDARIAASEQVEHTTPARSSCALWNSDTI
jgi:hypothetical protein